MEVKRDSSQIQKLIKTVQTMSEQRQLTEMDVKREIYRDGSGQIKLTEMEVNRDSSDMWKLIETVQK